MLHSPSFWWQETSALSRILGPLGSLYAAAGRLRTQLTAPQSFAVPVICVGNITLGGAGKTPLTLALAELLSKDNDVHIVSRGYGGFIEGPVQVNPKIHRYDETGDEPLLMARYFSCWVAKDRRKGIEAAIAAGATCVLMDDGLQNPTIRKTLSLVVVDGVAGFGNGKIFPAGPLRESIAAGLAKAKAVVVVGGAAESMPVPATLPCFTAQMVLQPEALQALSGKPVFAFAGIGRPEKFFSSLRDGGVRVAGARPFPDHHPYSLREMQQVLIDADDLGAIPVTTEKDHLRLPPMVEERIKALPARLVLDKPQEVLTLITQSMEVHR